MLLTVILQISAPSFALANEGQSIVLGNGIYQSGTRQLEIEDHKARIEVTESEVIEMELQRGIGPVIPGNFLYMDRSQEDSQVIVGNCKQLERMTCFFEITEAEKAADGNMLPYRWLVYEIEIEEHRGFLAVTLQKFQQVEGQERKLLMSLDEDFFLDRETSGGEVEVKSLK